MSDLATGEIKYDIDLTPAFPRGCVLTDDGATLFAASSKLVHVFDTTTMACATHDMPSNSGGAIAIAPDGKHVAVSSHGNHVAASSHGSHISLYSVPSCVFQGKGKDTGSLAHCIAISPSSSLLAAGGREPYVHVSRFPGLGALFKIRAHRRWVNAVVFIHDDVLATGGDDGCVKLWRLEESQCVPIRTLSMHTDMVYCMALSPDGQTLATGGADRKISIISLEDLTLVRSIVLRSSVTSIAWVDDATVLAAVFDDAVVEVDVAAGSVARPFAQHRGAINAISISKGDGKSVI